MTLTKGLQSVILFTSGLFLILCSYKIYEAGEEETYVQQHSPVIKMPVIYRVKGWGTIRVPNKIYVLYKGKKYVLPCSNKYFNTVAKLDSIEVNYDWVRDKAVLANVSPSNPYGLLIITALFGLIMTSQTVISMYRRERDKQ